MSAVFSCTSPYVGSSTWGDEEKSSVGETDSAPYIFCNETDQEGVIEQLEQNCVPGKEMHFGFSGWLNFDIIAATKPKGAIICDINSRMIDFYTLFKEILLESSNRNEFVEKLRIKLNEKMSYFDNERLFQLEGETKRSGSWLFSDEKFSFLKELHDGGKIQFRRMDATDNPEVYKALFNESGPFTTVYSSNIYEWLEYRSQEIRNLFKSNMKSLLSNNTYYIDAFYLTRSKKGSGPPLRITKGDLPNFVVAREKKVR